MPKASNEAEQNLLKGGEANKGGLHSSKSSIDSSNKANDNLLHIE